MRTQAISMPMVRNQACITRKNNNTTFKNGTPYVPVPTSTDNNESFASWLSKSIITASLFSVAWDVGTNIGIKMNWVKDAERQSAKQIIKNIPKIIGVFLLIGGIFKAVSNIIDKNQKF